MDYIVIASHGQYSEARDKLLASLWAEGVPRDRVVVVLNGCAGPDGAVGLHPDGYRVVEFGSNLFEYSAFFVPRVLGATGADRFLLLHDTSVACRGFGHKAAGAFARQRAQGGDILWCSSVGQCNLCVFNRRAGEEAWALWGSLRALDKRHAVQMEHYASAGGSIKGASALEQSYVEDPTERRGVEWPYSSGHERAVLHFPFLGVNKYFYDLERWPEHPNIP